VQAAIENLFFMLEVLEPIVSPVIQPQIGLPVTLVPTLHLMIMVVSIMKAQLAGIAIPLI